jgi:hypothetical protein
MKVKTDKPVSVTLPRGIAATLRDRLHQHARKCAESERRGVLTACAKFDSALAAEGDSVSVESTADGWAWLADVCARLRLNEAGLQIVKQTSGKA